MTDAASVNGLLSQVRQLMSDKTVSRVERTFTFSEISMLVDTIYKANVTLETSYGDALLEHLEQQNMLSLDYLQTRPTKDVLKIFRGCLIPTTLVVIPAR